MIGSTSWEICGTPWPLKFQNLLQPLRGEDEVSSQLRADLKELYREFPLLFVEDHRMLLELGREVYEETVQNKDGI